jgi:hypothetical protein
MAEERHVSVELAIGKSTKPERDFLPDGKNYTVSSSNSEVAVNSVQLKERGG